MTTTKTTIELEIRFNTAFRISQGYGQGENYEIGRASVGKECRSRWSPYH